MSLYTNNKTWKRNKTIPLTVASNNKILGINLTKEVEDLYTQNSKTLMKETKEDINKWYPVLTDWKSGYS